MRVCVTGNCQAQHLEMMLQIACPSIEVKRLKPVFQLDESDKDYYLETLRSADLVFAQRVADEFGLTWLSSASMRRELGEKMVIWPNVYFDGLFPGVHYIYMKGRGKLMGPLGDYHFRQIVDCHKSGRMIEQAVRAFAGDELFQRFPDPIGASINQLRSRENDSDLIISDFIERNFSRKRYFYTPNHPTNELLGEMLSRIGASAGLVLDIDRAVNAPYHLDEIYISASEAIVQKLNLPYDREPRYIGQEVLAVNDDNIQLGSAVGYSAIELVTAFYKLYDDVA